MNKEEKPEHVVAGGVVLEGIGAVDFATLYYLLQR